MPAQPAASTPDAFASISVFRMPASSTAATPDASAAKPSLPPTDLSQYKTEDLIRWLDWSQMPDNLKAAEDIDPTCGIAGELTRRREISKLLAALETTDSPIVRIYLTRSVLYQMDSPEIVKAFESRLRDNTDEDNYYVAEYLAKRGNRKALEILNRHYFEHGVFGWPVSSMQLAYTAELFGVHGYRPAIPNLVNSLDAAVLNLAWSAEGALELLYPDAPKFKNSGECRAYFATRAAKEFGATAQEATAATTAQPAPPASSPKPLVQMPVVAFHMPESAPNTIPFTYDIKTNKITLLIAGNKTPVSYSGFKDIVGYWRDLSGAPTDGIAYRCKGNEIVFQGALNPDQSIVFIYNTDTRKVTEVPCVTKLLVDEKLGWAVTKEAPHFNRAPEDNWVLIIVNGKQVAETTRDDLQEIKWDAVSGNFIISIKNPKEAASDRHTVQ